MKKILSVLLCLVLGAMLFTSCGEQEKVKDERPETPEVEEEKEKEDEFYTKMTSSDTRPIAIMIDNDADYKGPQAGLENAYMLYEAYVEGGSTRLMALFKDAGRGTDVNTLESRIGPVRSSRHYFLDFALENDAIYAHCGWSPKAKAEISSRGVDNVNGLSESSAFTRYSEYNSSWHNLYTTYDKILSAANSSAHSYRTTTDVAMNYKKSYSAPEAGDAATAVSIPYRAYAVDYAFDTATGLYMRSKKGSPHTMQSGTQLSAMNILILKMQNVPLNDEVGKGRQDLYDTGTGDGIYITGGKANAITWEKTDRSAKAKYSYASDKSEVSLNPGVTIVQIVPPDMQITVQ